MAKQVIRSLCFLAISIIDIEKEKSYILGCKTIDYQKFSKSQYQSRQKG